MTDTKSEAAVSAEQEPITCANCGRPIKYISRFKTWGHVSVKDGSRCEAAAHPDKHAEPLSEEQERAEFEKWDRQRLMLALRNYRR